jgi:hypothetical protein
MSIADIQNAVSDLSEIERGTLAAFGCGEELPGYSGRGIHDRLPDQRL